MRFEKRYENYSKRGKPCPVWPVSTVLMSIQVVHGHFYSVFDNF